MQTRVPKEKDGLMLSQFLIQTAADVPMWAIRETIKKRDVRIDGTRISGDVRVCEGQEIRVFWPKSILASEKKRFNVLNRLEFLNWQFLDFLTKLCLFAFFFSLPPKE